MVITGLHEHSLEELLDGGCEIKYSRQHCKFDPRRDREPLPNEVHLINIPEWLKQGWQDAKYWAPPGFRSLGLKALTSLDTEHPDLQRRMVIVATGAPDDQGPPLAVYYPYLTITEKGQRTIDVPYFGVGWKGMEKDGTNLFGVFERV